MELPIQIVFPIPAPLIAPLELMLTVSAANILLRAEGRSWCLSHLVTTRCPGWRLDVAQLTSFTRKNHSGVVGWDLDGKYNICLLLLQLSANAGGDIFIVIQENTEHTKKIKSL